jgi:very-short-patch-repair endonuclease
MSSVHGVPGSPISAMLSMDRTEPPSLLQRKKPLARRKPLKSSGMNRPKRRSSADAAATLWSILKDREVAGLKFRPREIVGPYVVDFVCPAARLAILIDGEEPRDPEQAPWLRANGYRVLTFSEREVRSNPGIVLDAVAQVFEFRVISRKS